MLSASNSVSKICCTSSTAPRVKAAARPALHGTTAAHANRRELNLQILTIGAVLLGVADRSAAADAGSQQAAGNANNSSSSGSSSSNSSSGNFIAIAPVNSKAKEFLDMRDQAMEFQCTGGMFDCDGDRREFAHKQYMDWLDSGGVPKRIREGNPRGPKSY